MRRLSKSVLIIKTISANRLGNTRSFNKALRTARSKLHEECRVKGKQFLKHEKAFEILINIDGLNSFEQAIYETLSIRTRSM